MSINVKVTVDATRLGEGQREELTRFKRPLQVRCGEGNEVILGSDSDGWIVDWDELCKAVKLAWEHKS